MEIALHVRFLVVLRRPSPLGHGECMKSRGFRSSVAAVIALTAIGCGVDASDLAVGSTATKEGSTAPNLPAETASSNDPGASSSPSPETPPATHALTVETKLETAVDGGTIIGKRIEPKTPSALGKRIILISGGPGAPDYMSPVAETLALAGHQVVRFDARGTGESRNFTTGFEMMHALADVDAIRRQAFGDTAVVVIGHSFGGLVAQYFAAMWPERTQGLIVSNSSVQVGPDQYAQWYASSAKWMGRKAEELMPGHGTEYVTAFLSVMGQAGNTSLSNEERQKAISDMFRLEWPLYFRDPQKAPPADATFLAGTSYPSFFGITDNVKSADPKGLNALSTSKYAGRILVVSSEDDMFDEAMGWILIGRVAGNAKYVKVANAGHIPFLEEQGIRDTYYGYIFDFLNTLK